MLKGTTILAMRHNKRVAIAGDGQITLGATIMKNNAKKVRLLENGKVIAGFAGTVADAFTLFEKFQIKLDEYGGSLQRAAVELAKEWRTDKYLRRLEAMLIVADIENLLVLSGTGEVIEPDNDIIGIGSGGQYAYAAALALRTHTKMSARDIVKESLRIAASICIYTNNNIIVEELK